MVRSVEDLMKLMVQEGMLAPVGLTTAQIQNGDDLAQHQETPKLQWSS